MDPPAEFRLPPLSVDRQNLDTYFDSQAARARRPLPNVHQEPRVDAAARARATPASVLIPIVLGEANHLVLTRRHHSISAPGMLCFPGGRADPEDATPVDTALREAHEEVGLHPSRVDVVGELGEYVSHSGFRIAPVVGVVTPPISWSPREGEVEEILFVPLDRVFDSRAYGLRRYSPERAHFFFACDEAGEVAVTGPTVSILMGLYRALATALAERGVT